MRNILKQRGLKFGQMMVRCGCGMKAILSGLGKHRETVIYYTVLLAVLSALSWSAYEYRNTDSPKEMEVEKTSALPEITVQSHAIGENKVKSKYILPIEGDIVRKYTEDEPIWSETLALWEVHAASDIGAQRGEIVCAAADGTVVKVYADPLYGNTAVIDHGDGENLLYGSLKTLKSLKVGQHISQGEIIGTAGTCIAEETLPAHVHLEYTVNGKPTDFFEALADANGNDLHH